MKGAAILYLKNQSVTVIEDVDFSVYEKIKKQCGCRHCTCEVENKLVDFGTVYPVFWHEDEIDWDYGY